MKGKNAINYLEFHKKSSIDKPIKLPLSRWPESWKRIYFKGYPRFERYALPGIKGKGSGFLKLFKRRKSRRGFESSKKISGEQLSYLLTGAKIVRVNGDIFYGSFRSYPSAGARFPLEVYIVVFSGKDLKKGLYHYHVRTHSLEYLWPVTKAGVRQAFGDQDFVASASAIIIITAMMKRTAVKYSDRGYRFALIEAGHLAQNVCLLATDRRMRHCPVGGFIDGKLIKLLDIDPEDELPLYAVAVQ